MMGEYVHVVKVEVSGFGTIDIIFIWETDRRSIIIVEDVKCRSVFCAPIVVGCGRVSLSNTN